MQSLSDIPFVSEEEVDQYLNEELNLMEEINQIDGKENLTVGEKAKSELCIIRAEIKKNLQDRAKEVYPEYGIAATELLAALLGNPTEIFLSTLKDYGRSFVTRYENNVKKYSKCDLFTVVPEALKLLNKTKTDLLIESMGINRPEGKRLWIESINILEDNLLELIKT